MMKATKTESLSPSSKADSSSSSSNDNNLNFVLDSKLLRSSKGSKKNVCCIISILLCGIMNIVLGILSLNYNYQNEFERERMRMRPGLPPMELWREPNVDIYLSVYLFNITNGDEFLNDTTNTIKLKLQQIGPIVYKQIVKQQNIVFHSNNSTMSYSTERTCEFLINENELNILNKTIITANPVLIGLAGYLNDESFFKKMAFNIIAAKDHVFLNRTIYEVLWNNNVPVLDSIQKILPFLVPRTNIGLLYNSYYPVERRFNVKIGPNTKYNEFFEMNTYNYETKIPGYKNENRNCSIEFKNARDGTCFPLHMKKDTIINVWREDLSRLYPFEFENEIHRSTFTAYKYTLKNETYRRFDNPEMDCFRGEHGIELPDGLIDSSKCAFDLPVAYSNPHFYGFNGPWEKYIDGLDPDKEKHSSYVVIEPETGVTLEAALRAQYNIPIPVNLSGFNRRLQKFKNMVVPTFWAEYKIKDVTTFIKVLTKLYILLPIIQPILIVLFFICGLYCLFISIRQLILINYHKVQNRSPKNLIFAQITTNFNKETENFLTS